MTKYERIRFTFRIPKELLNEIKIEAKKTNHSINSLILKILWEWIEEKQ